jgi:aminoglycoside phosphotransferase (APT) family kinase protein
MGREFNVLSKIKPHYAKVPQPIHYCADDTVIGAPFYIMERLKGVILRTPLSPDVSISPDQFNRLSHALVENLASLHSIDIFSTGLIELGKPKGYIQRQVEGWTKRYFQAETDKINEMNSLADWLQKHIPAEQTPTLLHNDYKYDNVVLHPNNITEIMGVLDWEMATVGDPLMDVGACLGYWSEAEDNKILQSFNITSLPGNITRKEFADYYAKKSNRDLTNILFYYVFGLFKNAVIAQQIYARWKQGHSSDERFGGLIHVIRALANQGITAIEKQSL